MPEINDVQPFKAYYYNQDKIKNIGDCLSQPYDVISEEQQESYYNKHEYNIVRIILNKITDKDNESDNRYTRANKFYSGWKKKEIIVKDKKPSFWIYEQEYVLPDNTKTSIRGFIGAVRLHEYDKGCILPHEKVMSNPVTDRMKLTKATKTQFESIWGFYSDSSCETDKILARHINKRPFIEYLEMPLNVNHKIWKMDDEKDCILINEIMKKNKIYIADGHHRYQTMLTLRNDMKNKHPETDINSPWEFINMYLVNSAHENLTIFPYHRMLKHYPDSVFKNADSLINALEEYFSIKSYEFKTSKFNTVKEKWINTLKDSNLYSFGLFLYDKKSFFILTLKEKEKYLKIAENAAENSSQTWKMLDANILNILVLNKLLGFTEEQLSNKVNIDYTHDINEAVENVRSGKMQLAFILNPTPLKQVISLSGSGEVLPRKSTFFYPKPITGAVFYPLEETDE